MEITQAEVRNKLTNKRNNAQSRGIEFSLNERDITVLYDRNPGFCEYTGLKFVDENPRRKPSIERIDSNKGYVRGNICLVSVEGNSLKNIMFDDKEAKVCKLDKSHEVSVKRILGVLTEGYLQKLKNKYNADLPKPEDLMETIDYLRAFKSPNQMLCYVDKVYISKKDENGGEGVEVIVPERMNMETRTASYFMALAKMAVEQQMEFSLTLSEMKALLNRKRCAFSKVSVDIDERLIFVKDESKPICKDNLTMVHYKFNTPLKTFATAVDMTFEEIVKNFKSFN